jgi:hypothetical protein
MHISKEQIKSDGYIKNQYIHLRNERITMFLKILVCYSLAVILLIVAAIKMTFPPPEQWECEQIVFSEISRTVTGPNGRHRVQYDLVTSEGIQYTFSHRYREQLEEKLVPNQTYNIVYSHNAILGFYLQAIGTEEETIIDVNNSIAAYHKEWRDWGISMLVTLFLCTVGSVFSYKFWCKKQRESILKIEAKIEKRMAKIQTKAECESEP